MTETDMPRLSRRDALKLTAGAGLGAMAAARAQAAGEVTLAIWTGYPELVPWYQGVAADFTKANPGVKATVFSTTLREHEQKLTAALPTGTGPDIFDVGNNVSVNFIDAGMIAANPPDVDKALRGGLYAPVSVEVFSASGKSYGLPLLLSLPAMYYNKTMFQEAGLAGPPQTFVELMDAARKLVKVDSTGKMVRSGISLRLSGQGSGIAEKWEFVLQPAGGAILTKTAGGKYHNGYDNDAGRGALQFYIDAVQKYHVDDPKVQHDADAFVAGNTAMLFREAWVIGEIEAKNPKLDYGVVPIPAWRQGMPKKRLFQSDGIYVTSKSPNQKAAWDFVKFATNPENSLKLTEMTGWIAARQDVNWKPLLDKTPQFETFVSPGKDVVLYTEPVIPPWDEIETRLAENLAQAYVDPSLKDNPQKVAETIQRWARQSDQLLREAGLYGKS